MSPPQRHPCGDCGEVHDRCTGHKRHVTPLTPCRAWPEDGADVCRMHGGGAPQVKAAAERRREAEKIRQAAAVFALPVDVDPATALLEEVHRSAGVVAWLEVQVERVAGESPDNLVRGTRGVRRTETADGNTTTTEAGPQVHEWLRLWQHERAHLVKVCAAALAAGVAERQVQLAEQQGALLVSVIRAILADPALALTPQQQAASGEVAARHLRAVRAAAG